jgi:hypothetical protein
MRAPVRLLLVLALLGPVGACSQTAEFFANLSERETPLPGERKPVFPGGVPGVSQGVPPEYLPQNQQQAAPPPAQQPQAQQPPRS